MDKSPDFCDWEVLHNSDASDSAAEDLGEFDQQLDSNSHAVFQSDYFSFDSHRKSPSSDEGSAVSDNPSWIDPASDTPFPPRNSADFWSDSGSDHSASRKLNDEDDKLESQFSSGQVEEKTSLVKYWSDSGKAFNLDHRNDLPFTVTEEFGAQGESKKMSDSSGVIGIIRLPVEDEKDADSDTFEASDRVTLVDKEAGDDVGLNSNDNLATEEMKPRERKEESARVVWWKLPLDMFKYCVFRVSPVWSFSVAAALVGFVILGRRLYKMKRKTHGLQLKVIIDDKKVSQFMSRAARLNEAFSVVRRVPVIRPSLPAPGAASWPVMSMR